MKKALIIGASGGIGRAVADQLVAQSVSVTRLSRRDDGLDITDQDSVERVLNAVEGPFDLIFVATGALGTPEKSLAAVTAAEMQNLFQINAIGPALLLRHAARLLAKDAPGVFAVLTARVGSIGDNAIGGWHSYRASKAAANQIVRGSAIELARTHKQSVVVALHPGTVETAFTANYRGRHKMVSPDAAAQNLIDVIAGLTPDQTGSFLAYDGPVIPW